MLLQDIKGIISEIKLLIKCMGKLIVFFLTIEALKLYLTGHFPRKLRNVVLKWGQGKKLKNNVQETELQFKRVVMEHLREMVAMQQTSKQPMKIEGQKANRCLKKTE